MSNQLQDGRVERVTSQWWRSPVVAACLRVLTLLGFAGLAWVAGMSTAHADAGSSASSAGSPAAPVMSLLEPATAPVARPLTTAVSPLAPYAAVAASPVTGSASGALAPATTPASDASVVDGAVALVTPVQDVLALDDQQSRSPGLLGSSALLDPLSVTQGLATSLGVDDAVAPLTQASKPLTDRISSVVSVLPKVKTPLRPRVRLPIDGFSPWTGDLPLPAMAERSITPEKTAVPAVPAGQMAGPVELSTAQLAALAAHSPDVASGPAVGAGSSAPKPPVPGPGPIPVLPGAALHSGSAAGSSSTQHDGSTGAVSTSGLAAGMLASRALAVTEDSGVTLVSAEDLSVSPD